MWMQAESVQAQYVDEDVPEKIPARFKSIGLNVSPVLPLIMGAIPINPRIGIVYKHQTKTSRKYRVTANVQFYDLFHIDPETETYNLSYQSDTTRSYQFIGDERTDVDLRFGMEWMNPDKKITPFYGFDLILGHASTEDYYGTRYAKLDTSYCETCFTLDPQNPGTFSEQRTYYLYTGFDFTVGWKILIKNHVDLYIQFAPEFRYQSLYREALSLEETKRFSPDEGLDIRIRAFETWISYRF
jgi:hypothetical protein